MIDTIFCIVDEHCVDSFWVCSQVSELRRLCTLREVLLSVDFASERGQQVIDPLLQCFFKASHIKQEEVCVYVSVGS